jgi:hypothetical protein
MVIILPGIMGSVLQKDGKDLWAVSAQVGLSALVSRGRSLEELRISNDDPSVDFLDDGIRATGLINGVQLVPGLVKIDGYDRLRKALVDRFNCIPGSITDIKPANLFEFPYDWRRDNRVAARLLQRFVEERLPLWRNSSVARTDAKVILLAHSMGGLVARHYLEVLGGWEHCHCLFSFGTPYSGSPHALGYLANGYKQFMLDLTETVRSFTSVYQLLPSYAAICEGGQFKRVAECNNLPNINPGKVKDAFAFYQKIAAANELNRKEEKYNAHYKTIPIIGVRQETLQSARWDGAALVIDKILPPIVHLSQDGGDGTVPRVSAVPFELAKQGFPLTFEPEKHSSLQSNDRILGNLMECLVQMQVPGLPPLPPLRGPGIWTDVATKPAISLQVDDLYRRADGVHLLAQVSGENTKVSGLKAEIEPISPPGELQKKDFRPTDEGWELELNGLFVGLFKLRVRALPNNEFAPDPVHDVFAVID